MPTETAENKAALTASDRDKMCELANDAQYMISNCATVFEMLRSGITGGWMDADTEGAAAMEFAARACKSFAASEADDLVLLTMKVSYDLKGADTNANE